jgi:hypothetical protein
MGLDAVELVMDVEDHFGITIQDCEAERARTVGDLVALIDGRLSAARETYCPTLPAFLKLRSTVRDAIGDSTFRIRPRQHIAQRLAAPQRRELWKRLSALLGSPPRGLRRPRALRRILAASLVAILAISVIAAVVLDIRILPLTLALAGLCILVLHIATVPFRSMPPHEWVTFGDVAAKIVGVTTATKQLQLRTADDILAELRPLIVNALGVNGDEVVSGARLVEDLGLG